MALLAGCAAAPVPTAVPAITPAVRSLDSYLSVYGGLEGVYRSIIAETSCPKLQELFYTATDNHTLGYQVVIEDRSKDLRCPELRFSRP